MPSQHESKIGFHRKSNALYLPLVAFSCGKEASVDPRGDYVDEGSTSVAGEDSGDLNLFLGGVDTGMMA